MKNKTIWAIALSILIFTVFMSTMSRLQDNGTFGIKDIEGQREYLNLFPIEGVAGDGTQGIIFRLEEGEISTKFYPFSAEQIQNMFLAQREGITGIEKYSYDHYNQGFYNQGFLEDVYAGTDSAPSQDAKMQHTDSIHEAVFEDDYLNASDFIGGETVFADKVDVYLNLSQIDGDREARVRTGMTLQDKTYYYTRGDYTEGTGSYLQSSFSDMQVDASCIEIGGAYYCMAIPSKECQGETSLFRIQKEGMCVTLVPPDEELFQQEEYGEAEVLRSFPVDQDNRVLRMFAIGDDSIGIFRVEKESLIFEIYDTEGNMTAQDLLTKELGREIDQIEVEVTVWDEGDVSVCFRMYDVVVQEDDSEVWENVANGLYQIDEKGLKRMNAYAVESGKLLSVCRNNLILDVSIEYDEKIQVPYYYGYQVYLTVMNGDTGKVLYHGMFETDYEEDLNKLFSTYNIAKKAPYLEEAMKTYYSGDMIGQRQREIFDVAPINGKVGEIWWR
ncbi:MAG: hypothetical protein PHG19_13120 [Anaerotignum sp.]|nr:hypothetical protein [Anaerotignum sp.]